MTVIQRLFTAVFGPDVERDTRQWRIECPQCGHNADLWERGGVRYKASGTKWTLGQCSACGHRGRIKIHRP